MEGKKNDRSMDDYLEYSNAISEQKSTTSDSEEDSWDIPIRTRQRFPRDQLKILENTYSVKKRPTHEQKEKLANKLGTSVKRIQIWFQNRRAKDKKIPSSEGSSSQMSRVPSPSPSAAAATATTSSPSTSTPNASNSTSTNTSVVPPKVETHKMSHAYSRSAEKRAVRFQRPPTAPRRYLVSSNPPPPTPEMLPMHFPTVANNTAAYYPQHHPYFPPEMWYPKFRIGPQVVNQSRTTTDQQQQKRTTRSQSKKRNI